jgi:histidinol-phosphate aminotransferase
VVPSLTNRSLVAVEPSPMTGMSRGPIRLDRNENAYPPSAAAIAAMHEAIDSGANRYPGAEAEALQVRLAQFHNVGAEQVVVGCGSRELLRLAVELYAGRAGTVIAASPTFELIDRFAQESGARLVSVPLTADHTHDLDAMLARLDGTAALVYVCNPNNPTGSLTPRKALEAFMERLPGNTHVLIDEAYHHYVGNSSEYASFIDRPVDDPRVIVTRSFSTIHGLAAMRIGYAVASTGTAHALAAHRLPESVTTAGARAAIAALADGEHVRLNADANVNQRQEFLNQANARMLKWIDSQTNFVLLDTLRKASDVVAHFESHGIQIAGPFQSFERHVRVSIGTPDAMREFWRVWDIKYKHAM